MAIYDNIEDLPDVEVTLSKVLDEIANELFEVGELVIDPYINRKLGNVIARLSYHISKLKRDE